MRDSAAPETGTSDQRTAVFRASDAVILLSLTIIGAGLRFYRLDSGLWYDEITTLVSSVRLPLAAVVSEFPTDNNHPLFSVLAHLAIAAFGEDRWALRLPAALFGVASIPMLYLLGTAIGPRREAAAATMVLTVSYHHIWFSQNARGYTMLAFFALLSTYALIRWFDTGRQSFLRLYVIGVALGAYSHVTMVIICIAQAGACAVHSLCFAGVSRVREEWARVAMAFVGAGVGTALLYAPMTADMASFFAVRAPVDESAGWGEAVLAALQGLQAGFGGLWPIILGAIVFVVGLWCYLRHRLEVALFFLLPPVAIVLFALVFALPVRPRLVLFTIGFVLLVAVRGVAVAGETIGRMTAGRLFGSTAGSYTAIALFTVGAVVFSVRALPYGYRYPKQDYEQAVRHIESSRGAADVAAVVGLTSAMPVQQYLKRPWPRIDRPEDLDKLRAGARRVWVMYTFPVYIETHQPELWTILRDECAAAGNFEGTVAGGTISVRRCP